MDSNEAKGPSVRERERERERELFEQALEVPPEGRGGFLREACGSDRELHERVQELLVAERAAGGFLGGGEVGFAGAGEGPRELAGRYRLGQRIGEGGFGEVFLAEQIAPVRRRVAVKILKAGMDSRQVVARFEVERQALALMEHPNIAKVFDAGTTPEGRPFFVMEWVEGAALTRHCDEARMPVAGRLGLFVEICDALQHAHQKGIIHRDLKPSNVLVARQGDRAVPKVIDFGIAKAIQPESAEAVGMTRAFELLGTPAYMSPEQGRFTTHDVDIRTDIYSLGVLLHELLIGRTPLDEGLLRTEGWDAWRRRLRDEEAVRLPARWRALSPAERAEAAARRGTTVPGLGRGLRGDLEWIVARCLEREPGRRYDSAAALAADVQRHLAHEPVVAAAPGAFYRMAKFLRRHRWAVAGGVTVGVALMAATVVSLVHAGRARVAERMAQQLLEGEIRQRRELERLRRLADEEAARARTEAATARAVTRFLNEDVLASADPAREVERELTLRTVLDRASRQLSGRLTNEPAVAAAIHQTLGRAYLNLSMPAAAAPHFESARDLYAGSRGAVAEETLGAAIEYAFARHRAEGWTNALPSAEATTALARERFGRGHPLSLHCGARLAWIHYQLGRLADWHRVAEETYQDAQGSAAVEDADLLGVMYLVARKRGRSAGGVFEAGEQILLQAVQLMHERRGAEHALAVRARANLAVYYYDHWRHVDRAEELFLDVLENQRRLLGENHESTLTTLSNLGLLYVRAERPRAAQRMFLGLLAVRPDDQRPRRWLPELLAAAPLRPAAAGGGALAFRWRIDEPVGRWTVPDFDDSAWMASTGTDPGPRWGRASFELSAAPSEPLVVSVSGVARGEILFNGLAAGPEFVCGSPEGVLLIASADSTRALRAGRNVVAIRIAEAREGEPFQLRLHGFPEAESGEGGGE